MRGRSLFVCALLLMTLAAGCLTPPQEPERPDVSEERSLTLRVRDAETGAALPFVQVTARAAGTVMAIASTAPDGAASMRLAPGVDELLVQAEGYPAKRLSPAGDLDLDLALSVNADDDAMPPARLAFRAPLDLGTQTYPLAVGTACLEEDQPNDDCGLGEPTIEVDGSGTIYLSGVCCIGAAPPVLVSRDDGASFHHLETPGVREAFGIEGDFAIDADGVMYFLDIELAATFQVTAWDADGTYLRHMKWPAPPLVDRPWVRAEGSGILYYVYNTGSETNVYTSEDGGMTWSPTPRATLPYALGNPAKGPAPGELWVIGGSVDGMRRADVTYDGGATWATETTTSPVGGNFPVGYFDAGGNLYLVANADETITVARRGPDGTWHEAMNVTPEWGTHRFPWIAAGGEGDVAVAWYGTMDDKPGPDSEWYLFVAASVDAATGKPHWAVAKADPVPVLVGDLERQLLDFLQLEIGPRGAIHVGYSKVPESGGHEQLHYVQSLRELPLAPDVYPWGPVASTAAGAPPVGKDLTVLRDH